MTDFGLKSYVIDVKTLSDHNSAPFGVGTSSLDIMWFSTVFYMVTEKFWLCLTDFELKNYVFGLKTLLGYISAPFLSCDFIFGHNVIQHRK